MMCDACGDEIKTRETVLIRKAYTKIAGKPDVRSAIIDARKSGMTYREIAEKFDVALVTAWKVGEGLYG